MHLLRAHGVTVSFHPVVIAHILALSGNKPPWFLQAKARYLTVDSLRAARRVGLDGLAFPKNFLSMSLTTSPMRALHHIKAAYPEETFLDAAASLFQQLWRPPHVNLTLDENLARALLEATGGAAGTSLFTADEVVDIMASRDASKDALKANTEEAVKRGAFGAPWLWATNAKGEGQAFFGSDR